MTSNHQPEGVLPTGKLPSDLLTSLLAQVRALGTDPSVLIGPRPGEDAAAVRLSQGALVAASDPVTFATAEIGWYAVHVNANDVAVCGAAPRWFLATLLLPEGAAPDLAATITGQITAACAAVGATLIGGHTEITAGLTRPLVIGTMLGEVAPERLIATGGAQPGDDIILTQGIAIEGTALIATELAETVDRHLGQAAGARCRRFLHEPGISVVTAARHAAEAGVHALHDPTEGGLATALHELAATSDCGLLIEADRLPIYPETQALCTYFGLDPLGLIASGALLIAVSPADRPQLLTRLAVAGIPATAIGSITPAGSGRLLRRDGQLIDLPTFARDEVTRLF